MPPEPAEISIAAAVRENAERQPDRPAITHAWRTPAGETEEASVTWRELDLRTNRLARAYEKLGVEQDRLVTIALPNGIGFLETAVACWKLGAIPQPVSARLPKDELEAIVGLADPALVVGGPEITGRPQIQEDFEPDPSLPDEPLPDRISSSWKAPTSGGSTGRPKIILSGQRGTTQRGLARAFGLPRDEVVVVPGVLYHNAPFQFAAVGLFRGNHVIVTTRFDASLTLELCHRHRATWMWVVPTMMSRIMRLPEAERSSRDLSSLRQVWHGAAPCPPWVKEAWIEWLGPGVVWELYAGTEGQGLCVIGGKDWLSHRGSVGRPVYGKMKILSEDGAEFPPGEVGEIYMLPPDPKRPTYRYVGAEAKTLDGWESIGDMGWMDDDGYIYIADRRTDLILSGGANVYPAEVEAALDEHPKVATCAVIGLPDDDMGQVVHAIIQPHGRLDEGELKEFLASRLAPYKIPRTFELSDEPLRDDAGKVRRSQLRDQRIG